MNYTLTKTNFKTPISTMQKYSELNVHQKIQIKQYAMDVYGKRWHISTPNFLSKLNELQIHFILN